MELSLVSARPLPRPAASPLLFAPLKPLPLLRFPPRKRTAFARLRSRRSRRVAASGEGEGDAADRDEEVFGSRSGQVFGGRRELTGVQPLVEALPPVARTAAELAVPAASPLLFAPLKPLPLLRFPPRKRTAFARLRSRRSRRVAASGEGEGDAADRDEEVFGGRSEQVFGGRRELTGVQPLVEALPPVARTARSEERRVGKECSW